MIDKILAQYELFHHDRMSKWRGIIGVMWRLGARRVSHDPRLRGIRGFPHGPASS